MRTLPGNCAPCIGSCLTPKPLFVPELLFAPSVAQELWDKDSSGAERLTFFWIFKPMGFSQVAEKYLM